MFFGDDRSPGQRLSWGGLVIAVIGFGLTRFTVALAVDGEPLQFLLAGILPLIMGLSLSAFGVALAVGSFEPRFVRTVATWCVLGTAAMLVLVTLTLLGTRGRMPAFGLMQSDASFANVIIGGSVGGTFTGIYAGLQQRQQRAVREQSNRLIMLNRILRDEVINAVMAIKGHAEVARERDDGIVDDRLLTVVEEKSETVESTIENVKYLTQTSREAETNLKPVAVGTSVESAVETVRSRHPDMDYEIDCDQTPAIDVWANERFGFLLQQLVENAVVHSDGETPQVAVDVTGTNGNVQIAVSDDGPGLPESQQELLESGTIAEYDDPTTGFGLNVVRLLMMSYGGDIDVDVTDSGTTITLELERAVGDQPTGTLDPTDVRSFGVAPSNLGVATGAALVAGALMGVAMQTLAGIVPVIGALYGVTDPFVGWITHEFHRVVFGMVYAGLLAAAPDSYAENWPGRLTIGVSWALVLWLIAAGLVMPFWLRLLGITVTFPNLTLTSLVGHFLWGVTISVFYQAGQRLLEERRHVDSD